VSIATGLLKLGILQVWQPLGPARKIAFGLLYFTLRIGGSAGDPEYAFLMAACPSQERWSRHSAGLTS